VKAHALDLDRVEALALCDELLGPNRSPATVSLVRDGRVVALVDARLGPARRPASTPLLLGARASAGARVLALDVAAPPADPLADLAASLLALPSVGALLAAAARLRMSPAWLVEDGVYALGVRADADGPAALICARVRSGRLERLVGGSALETSELPADAAALAELALRKLGRPVAVAMGTRSALRAIAHAPRPLSALERARIRRFVEVQTPSRRTSFTLVALRVLGLV